TVGDPELLVGHARLLAQECLPRLIAGHRLPSLETDPDPSGLTAPSAYRTPSESGPVAALAALLSLTLWAASCLAIIGEVMKGRELPSRLVAGGLLISALATLAGFVLNRNIFNSDNYRYLVTLLVPWSVGFGLLMSEAWRRGLGARVVGLVVTLAFASLMTADLASWYARFGWIDAQYRPLVAAEEDPLSRWLAEHPQVTWLEGGYWDVYRLAFLTGGSVRGTPFPIYPNRFPEWRPSPVEGRVLIGRSTPESAPFLDRSLRAGGKVVFRARGATVVEPPASLP
ncbi:MAG: hypothetical protein AB7I30_14995, partial [Isosphaeraceae bacterium]